jgi:hypothetical protein
MTVLGSFALQGMRERCVLSGRTIVPGTTFDIQFYVAHYVVKTLPNDDDDDDSRRPLIKEHSAHFVKDPLIAFVDSFFPSIIRLS